jgi:hypothetical protein
LKYVIGSIYLGSNKRIRSFNTKEEMLAEKKRLFDPRTDEIEEVRENGVLVGYNIFFNHK